MNRKVCIITDSRAEYGIMRSLIREIDKDPELDLQIIVTGAHLVNEFGLTYKDIEKDGYQIDYKVESTLASDTPEAICKSIGLGCISMTEALSSLQPSMVVLLGDRYEMLSSAICAFVKKIPIAHLHGGEVTEGAIDDAFRHSITKMAYLHFTSTENHRKRVVQLGEDPSRVFNFGAPGLDNIHLESLMSLSELSSSIEFDIDGKTALVTYHPVTLEDNSSEEQVDNMLRAISNFDFKAVFTATNTDTYGRVINERVKEFCRSNPDRYKFVTSLGQRRYLSALRHFDLMIGNSSSGIIESGSFAIPVVNIGNRQKGRQKGPNVIDCEYGDRAIISAIKLAIGDEFKKSIIGIENPYGGLQDGKAGFHIKEKIKEFSLEKRNLMKSFYDM
ncbi:MAG: UDP-N-acetylglucosamine 2-epimerase (hydrolyzing) [Bdellovibrionales bacterium]|nr:UDP-N-acetylglucosamine 2-epimerase (hydrolyzing) [Bdellovibrionales bacterium]